MRSCPVGSLVRRAPPIRLLSEDDEMARKGCTAAVHEIVDELDDGRLNILVEGRERFALGELIEPDDPEAGYLRGRIELFDDIDEAVSVQAKTQDLAAGLFQSMVGLMGVEDPRVPDSPARLSYRLAAAGATCRSASQASRSPSRSTWSASAS